jgi:hypothetical protein
MADRETDIRQLNIIHVGGDKDYNRNQKQISVGI